MARTEPGSSSVFVEKDPPGQPMQGRMQPGIYPGQQMTGQQTAAGAPVMLPPPGHVAFGARSDMRRLLMPLEQMIMAPHIAYPMQQPAPAMANTASSMDTLRMADATYQPQHSEGPHSWPVPSNAHAFQHYQISNIDHSAHNLPRVVSQGVWAGSVPSSGATLNHAEYPETLVEHELPGGDCEVAVEGTLNECDEVPCPSRTEGRKGSRKRGRDWTDEETSVLVECKRACFEDKGSGHRKQKSSATNWDAIAEAVRDSRDTCGASEKTGDQCRLRWDTLVKSHRLIKERCVESGKEYAEVMAQGTRSLKLATNLKPEWYEVIYSISGMARSRKQSNLGARKSKNGGEGDGPVSGGMGGTEAGSHTLLLEGGSVLGTGSIPAAPRYPGMSKPRRKAVQRFQSLGPQLRSTLLDIILSERYLSQSGLFQSLSRKCEWLSIVQSRSRSDVYNDVSMLMQMRLVHVVSKFGDVIIDRSGFRMLEKFVKKLIEKNPVLDTHTYLGSLNDKKIYLGRDSMTPHRIRVLTLDKCKGLESVDLRGLRKLRSLIVWHCPVLKEITGWKYLRELGWLKIFYCRAYADCPDIRDLPSLRVCILDRNAFSGDPGYRFDISQCVRLRRLWIWFDAILEESGDLSSLKCLEELEFICCFGLSIIEGLSEVHSLTRLVLFSCNALQSLPDIGHMKELVHIDISYTSVEEIPGIEKLVSLKTLDCTNSKLKHLPDLHHLPELQKITLSETPLIEEDPSSFYFDNEEVFYNREESSVLLDVMEEDDVQKKQVEESVTAFLLANSPRENLDDRNLEERGVEVVPEVQMAPMTYFYPPGDRFGVEITEKEMNLLKPGMFFNDNIIDFYMRYLQESLYENKKHKFHVCSSYLFTKLQSAYEKGSGDDKKKYQKAYEAIQNWINPNHMFKTDYTIIPINDRAHWSLVIVCYANKVCGNSQGGSVHSTPVILHMDSMNGMHSDVEKYIRNFLIFAWLHLHREKKYDDGSEVFRAMKYVEVEVPQQKNGYDCGPFMLHFMEVFLRKEENSSNPERTEMWFEESEVNTKRYQIHDLILKLYGKTQQ